MTSTFASYHSYQQFASSVLSQARFFPTRQSAAFLRTLLSTSKDKRIQLRKGEMLYRSQKGYDEIQEGTELIALPYKAERMLPKADKVKDGRVNSAGIPVLYLSDDAETAASESRPWLDEGISIAALKIRKNLLVLDLSRIEKTHRVYLREPDDPDIICRKVWADVAYAFSRPIGNDDQEIGYLPTQVMGEYFRRSGLDGIKYKSLLGKGNNYALFDISSVEMINGVVLQVSSMTLALDQLGNNVTYHDQGKTVEYNVLVAVDRAPEATSTTAK